MEKVPLVQSDQRCWFCGQPGGLAALGWSLPVLIESDYRLEYPLQDHGLRRLTGEGSPKAVICAQCIREFKKQLGTLSDEYLELQQERRHEVDVLDADVAGGLLESEEREWNYGCWFGTFPIMDRSLLFIGKSLLQLNDMGIHILSNPFHTSRCNFERFVELAPHVHIERTWDSESTVRELTAMASLVDDEMRDEDTWRLVTTCVWILDVALWVLEE